MTDLTFQDLLLARFDAAKAHELKGGEHGRQRISELMPQHGQEFVFRPICRFGFSPKQIRVAVRPRVANRRDDLRRRELEERAVAVVERSMRTTPGEENAVRVAGVGRGERETHGTFRHSRPRALRKLPELRLQIAEHLDLAGLRDPRDGPRVLIG